MSIRTIVIIVFALVTAGAAAVGINMMGSKGNAAPRAMTHLFVATDDVPQGELLTASMVKSIDWPSETPTPKGAALTLEDVLDRAPLQSLQPDELILTTKLASKGAGRGVTSLIPVGMRAFTIQTPTIVSPRNKVDVHLTEERGSREEKVGITSSSVLLQNIEILAVDGRTDSLPVGKVEAAHVRTVMLLVTPEEATKLSLVQNRGTLHLSLRNPTDALALKTLPATRSSLTGDKPPEETKPRPAAPPPAEPTIKIRLIKDEKDDKTIDIPRSTLGRRDLLIPVDDRGRLIAHSR